MPFSLDDNLSVPPSWRTRSFIPRSPTPSVPSESAEISSTPDGAPLPSSCTSRMTFPLSRHSRTRAVGLPECRWIFVRHS